jgi:hypothetical protein
VKTTSMHGVRLVCTLKKQRLEGQRGSNRADINGVVVIVAFRIEEHK